VRVVAPALVRVTHAAGVMTLTPGAAARAGGRDLTASWLTALSAASERDDVRVGVMHWRMAEGDHVDGAAVAAALAGIAAPVVLGIAGRIDLDGMAVVLAADLVVAARRASFDLRGAGTAAVLRGGIVPRLARAVGPGRASAIALLGGPLRLRDAVALGIVREIVPAVRLRARLRTLAADLAARGPLALALAKEAVTRALDLPLADGIKLEHDLYVLLQTTADRGEGIRAFRAHRAPRFQGL
jgi:enoyl-CoA hydratase/carnithine racemase